MLRALEETGRPDLAHVGVAARELGHIRVRLGDTEGAEQAFRRAHEYGISPGPGMSLVRSVLMGLVLPTVSWPAHREVPRCIPDPAPRLAFRESRPYGGAYVLDALWQRLGIGSIVAGLASSGRGRPRDAAAAERVLFGLVANRALAPSSKLAASGWMSRDVHIDGLSEVTDDACYRAMDWLHAVRGELEKQVYFAVAGLLDLEVDLLFFDTTSTYFELEDADEEVARNWRGEKASADDADPDDAAGFRAHGKSKDSRDDLPQIVIGLAVTRDGIPVRCWCWPGSTSD